MIITRERKRRIHEKVGYSSWRSLPPPGVRRRWQFASELTIDILGTYLKITQDLELQHSNEEPPDSPRSLAVVINLQQCLFKDFE
ncbi:hypothetical protein NPIL_167851 [Nephila pilipes]|uniref:Uncharacterized protein n=1 Tax=Nephila pilipes TaxID=299642 RepID=A0A8X6PI61_NEPPI|nr:hypothetical protein NPIL_167851 [Nephila pilipes]